LLLESEKPGIENTWSSDPGNRYSQCFQEGVEVKTEGNELVNEARRGIYAELSSSPNRMKRGCL
jgi:hypothetical protein